MYTTSYEEEREGIRVEITWIGEGLAGDDQDMPLARFYVQQKVDGEWQDMMDASYCTMLPADDYEGMKRLAGLIFDRAGDALRQDSSYKHILEELSWFNGANNEIST